MTVTNYFSKWPEGAPLKDKTAVGVDDFLFTVFCRHGWPDIVTSDQGREFVNQLSGNFQLFHAFKPLLFIILFSCLFLS